MKKLYASLLTTVLLLLVVTSQSVAQERTVERIFSHEKSKKINLDLKFGEIISVKAWDKNEVSFRAVIEINKGKLNDALVLDFKEQQDGLFVTGDYNKDMLKGGRREDCPDRYSQYNWNNDGEGYTVCSNIVYEVLVPREANIKIESISSDIEINGVRGPIYAKSISGFVDLSWPAQQGADVSMKTITGEVYSGLPELTLLNKKQHNSSPVGYELRGSISGGGPRASLESISGNIYLRPVN